MHTGLAYYLLTITISILSHGTPHTRTFTHSTASSNLKKPTQTLACLSEVRGSQRSQWKSIKIHGGIHAGKLHTDANPSSGSDHSPTRCNAVLTNAKRKCSKNATCCAIFCQGSINKIILIIINKNGTYNDKKKHIPNEKYCGLSSLKR